MPLARPARPINPSRRASARPDLAGADKTITHAGVFVVDLAQFTHERAM